MTIGVGPAIAGDDGCGGGAAAALALADAVGARPKNCGPIAAAAGLTVGRAWAKRTFPSNFTGFFFTGQIPV